MKNWPKVSIVVLNWNRYELTKECLESLEAITYPNYEVILVDNASADGSGARLCREFPQHQFIQNEANLGFARGCNVGVRAALEDENCAYVLLLNNDATATTQFLEKAVETAEANSRVGLVGGKILYSVESKKIWYAGGYLPRWRGGVKIRGFREIDRGQYDSPCEVGFVTGALMLIKREVLEKVGLLPEEYFFGIEEYDYCSSVRRTGYELFYVPEFLVYHKADGSHSNYDVKFVYNNYRSKLIYQEKFLPKGLFPLWKRVFSLYGKLVAKHVWQKLRNGDENLKDKRIPLDELSFAIRKALEDHGKDILSEETLNRFDEQLKRRRRNGSPD